MKIDERACSYSVNIKSIRGDTSEYKKYIESSITRELIEWYIENYGNSTEDVFFQVSEIKVSQNSEIIKYTRYLYVYNGIMDYTCTVRIPVPILSEKLHKMRKKRTRKSYGRWKSKRRN